MDDHSIRSLSLDDINFLLEAFEYADNDCVRSSGSLDFRERLNRARCVLEKKKVDLETFAIGYKDK